MRAIVSYLSNSAELPILGAFFFLFLLFLFRSLLRNEWVAAVAWVLFLAVFLSAGSQRFFVALVVNLILNGVTVFLLTRLGFLALTTSFVFNALLNFPLTTQASAWYAGIGFTAILVMAAIAIYGFYTSFAGRPVFGGAVLED